jgi:hypothetical protein
MFLLNCGKETSVFWSYTAAIRIIKITVVTILIICKFCGSTRLIFTTWSLCTVSLQIPDYCLRPNYYLQFLCWYQVTSWDKTTICNSCASKQLLFKISLLILKTWPQFTATAWDPAIIKNLCYYLDIWVPAMICNFCPNAWLLFTIPEVIPCYYLRPSHCLQFLCTSHCVQFLC